MDCINFYSMPYLGIFERKLSSENKKSTSKPPPFLGKRWTSARLTSRWPSIRIAAVLGFPVEPSKWHYYLSRSLPFGATSSVYAFNKIALALLHIVVVKFFAMATDFYDDYTVFDFQPCAALLDKVLMRLLTLLGWLFAKDGERCVPFASTVVSLAVSIDLSPIWKGAVEVANKPGRLDKVDCGRRRNHSLPSCLSPWLDKLRRRLCAGL